MSEFQSEIDIGDRACQHVGVPRINRTRGFTEDRKATQEIAFVYGKLRQAELQRNYWTFAIKRAVIRPIDTTTMLLAAALWTAETTYFVGSIVSDDLGNLWVSNSPNNLGNRPQNTSVWVPYFGPLTVHLYDSTVAYQAGELVYTTDGDGQNRVFMSLQSANEDDPATPAAWDETVTYRKNQVARRSSVNYMSLIDLNLNQDPALAPVLWSAVTTYGSGTAVGASDGTIYTSAQAGNLNHDPVGDDGTWWTSTGVMNPWTTVFTAGATPLSWLQIGGTEFPNGVTLSTPNVIYPIGAGPSSQSTTRNVYRLPCNFLRKAPQDPKAGSVSYLGASSALAYDDWLIEAPYLVSAETGPIVLRFVADVTDVRLMHAMFCEGLGARIGLAVCEPITQSRAKLADIAQEYQKFMGDARLVDAIEAGAIEAPEDDYISCRA